MNALGQVLAGTDRNGTTHAASYDVLGRATDDAVILLGVNVDGAVRRVRTDYDGQGHASLITNYSAAVGGTVVSHVQRAYNGLGQLFVEYQAHGGESIRRRRRRCSGKASPHRVERTPSRPRPPASVCSKTRTPPYPRRPVAGHTPGA